MNESCFVLFVERSYSMFPEGADGSILVRIRVKWLVIVIGAVGSNIGDHDVHHYKHTCIYDMTRVHVWS